MKVMTGDPYAMEIASIDIIQVVEVVIALAATYLIARIVTKTLEAIGEKTFCTLIKDTFQ